MDSCVCPHPQQREGGERCQDHDCDPLLSCHQEAGVEGVCREPPGPSGGHSWAIGQEVLICRIFPSAFSSKLESLLERVDKMFQDLIATFVKMPFDCMLKK